ncbi:hypothetical protein BJY17_000005 [Agromyces hippuratus]|uniref:Uncharacterized protein n=1 Tax=Agromyces hippuratus TaxID=286438 RepID=A0A852WNX0_9MICO|nr:hypothetical protein [Agromyces hippuratus]NYG19258.1 hypothetical protein [Agromyces hippuratus]
MSSVLDDVPHHERVAHVNGLPPIGLWWPMLERPLRREVLENVHAPLRAVVVRRIYELCELDPGHAPKLGMRLGENERAYIAGWMHSVDWN